MTAHLNLLLFLPECEGSYFTKVYFSTQSPYLKSWLAKGHKSVLDNSFLSEMKASRVWRGVHEMGCSEVPASVRAWCPGFAYQLILQRSVLNPWRLGFWFGILWVVSAVSDNWRWTLTIPRMKERQRGLVCFRHNLSPWSLSSLTRCSACWIFALHLLVLGSKREQELFEDREGRVCKHPVWRILVEVGILMVVTSRHNY